MGVLQLYMTDFCPFAQRAWLALLEKEKDPRNPQLFNYIEINYFNPSLPLTQEFLKIHNTVPCGTLDGQVLKESMPMCYFADEVLAPGLNPLQPADEEGKKSMKALIEKCTSGEFDVVSTMYNYLFVQPDEKEELAKWNAKLLRAYAELAKELSARGGPYLMGAQFTLADIAIIPFVDRAIILLGHYKGFAVPQTAEYAALHAWRKAYMSRASHQISHADRLPRSVAVQPFAETQREKYLIEMYASYGNNVRAEVRRQLRHAPPGKATQDIPAALAEKAAEQAATKAKVRQHRILAVTAAVGLAAIVAVKAAQFFKNRKQQ